MSLLALLFACSGAPSPEPTAEPLAPEIPSVERARAPVTLAPAPEVDPAQAAPRTLGTLAIGGPGPADALSVVYHSRGEGDIEPCGCPRQPAGGLARRRAVIESTRATAAALLLEGGESLLVDTKGRAPSGQERAKARLIASEWVEAGLGAAAVGAVEWQLGRAELEGLAQAGYPLTAANLICAEGERPWPAARIGTWGGRSVAVVGLTVGPADGCLVTDPVQAARELLDQPEVRDAELRILLWPARGDEAWIAAQQRLGYDMVLDASGRIAAEGAPLHVGGSWLLGVGHQTKSVGIVDLGFGGPAQSGFFPVDHADAFDRREARVTERLARAEASLQASETSASPAEQQALRAARDRMAADATREREAVASERAAWAAGAHHRAAFRTVLLTEDVSGHAPTAARVAAVKSGFANLPDASGAAVLARPMKAAHGSAYAGTATCASCHPAAYRQWQSTGHARALGALIKVDRHADDACWSCHVTGAAPAESAGFPVEIHTAADVGGMLHVQCEACHGPGAAHVADPASARLVRSPPASTCVGCHDGVRDEGRFDHGTYLPRVSHTDPVKPASP